tara:strand:+ start:5127 stop:5669 length:543 start_codon:yes stop_codon:yes gene_type:complete
MLKNVKNELNKFAKYVIQQSRTNLTKGRNPYGSYNDTKKLYNSLKAEPKVSKNSFELSFLMEDYGVFLDKGVKGKTSSAKAPESPFQFGSGTGKKGGLTEGINKWVKRKGFQFIDKKSGRFMSYDSTAFLISRSIYNKGTKPSMFFTKPFEKAFKNLPDELVKAFSLDVEELIKTTINNK